MASSNGVALVTRRLPESAGCMPTGSRSVVMISFSRRVTSRAWRLLPERLRSETGLTIKIILIRPSSDIAAT